jgi:hypothetical protein
MRVLTKRDEKVIRALSQCLLSRGGAVVEDAVDASVVERIDRWMLTLNHPERLKMRGLFHLFDLWYAIHSFNPFGRFVKASKDQQAMYLSTWEQSDMYSRRLAFQGLRQIISIAYMEHSGVRRGMGIDDSKTPEQHLKELAQHATLLKAPSRLKDVS